MTAEQWVALVVALLAIAVLVAALVYLADKGYL